MITLDQHIDELTTKYTQRITRFTVQLYEYNEDHKKYKTPYLSIASGVLISHDERYFIITAGHVISDHNKGNIGILEINTFYRLINEGQNIFYIDPDKSSKYENFDITIWELDSSTTSILNKYYDFLTPENVVLEDEYPLLRNYLIIGFPSTMTKFNFFKSRLRPKVYKFLTRTVDESIYKLLKLDSKINFVVQFNQRKVRKMGSGIIRRSVKLEGISGCGIWYIPDPISNVEVSNNFYLVSIVFKHDINKKYIISLKTKVIINILREKFHLY